MWSVFAAVVLSAAPGEVTLQALVPTSGSAEALLDGDAATGWTPEGDPNGEGVLLRFEEPVAADKLELKGCPGTEGLLQLYVNGALGGGFSWRKEQGFGSVTLRGGVRSLFLKQKPVLPGTKVCVGELLLSAKGERLAVKPPRTVKATVTASSTLEPADAYHVGYLSDGRTDFGWVEGVKGNGEGESVTVTLEQPVELVGLELWNGYQRSADHFKKNARAAAVTVAVDDGAPLALPVKDAQGPQKLLLAAPAKAKVLKLTITKAVKGTKYQDLVLSELRLLGPDGPITLRTADMASRRKALEAEVAGKALADVVDRELRAVCGHEADVTLKLRTNHTFVSYEEGGGELGSKKEIFDGAWIVRRQGGPWSTIELFGRRHRTESEYRPYRGEVEKETVVISGGPVQVARVKDLGEAEFVKLVTEWTAGPAASRVDCLAEEKDAGYARLVGQGAVLLKGVPLVGLYAAP